MTETGLPHKISDSPRQNATHGSAPQWQASLARSTLTCSIHAPDQWATRPRRTPWAVASDTLDPALS